MIRDNPLSFVELDRFGICAWSQMCRKLCHAVNRRMRQVVVAVSKEPHTPMSALALMQQLPKQR